MDDQVYHSAPYSARLLGRDNVESDYVYQAVQVPSGATKITLDFWYRVSSSDSSSETPHEDFMCVEIINTEFSFVLADIICPTLHQQPQEQWINSQYVLTGSQLEPLLGQTVLVSFQGWAGWTQVSTVWVDDVSFRVTASGQ